MTRHFEPLTPNSKTHDPIDWGSPDQIAMQNEEPDDEFIDAGSIKNIPVSALKDLIRFLLPPNKCDKIRLKSGVTRLAILAHLASVDNFGNLSLTDIAARLGITRAAASWHHCNIMDSLGLGESRSSKSRSARETYSRTAKAAHARAGHKMSPPPSRPPNA
jgi:hypothetical protein